MRVLHFKMFMLLFPLCADSADRGWGPGMAVPPGISWDLYRSLQTYWCEDYKDLTRAYRSWNMISSGDMEQTLFRRLYFFCNSLICTKKTVPCWNLSRTDRVGVLNLASMTRLTLIARVSLSEFHPKFSWSFFSLQYTLTVGTHAMLYVLAVSKFSSTSICNIRCHFNEIGWDHQSDDWIDIQLICQFLHISEKQVYRVVPLL